jgi:cellulose synthase/poly-beta-1,6-N-acetylglucosamine synthase-like glycosyltransferase
MSYPRTELLFWISVAALAYSYVGYFIVMFLIASVTQTSRDLRYLFSRRPRRAAEPATALPTVAMLVAAYNEENVIAAKLENVAQTDYPAEKWELLLGLDAPTDSTAQEAQQFAAPWLRLFPFPVRRGKLAVLKDLANNTIAEVLVFSDANTMLAPDAAFRLARHFADSRVGAVCGELRLVGHHSSETESLYWRYEAALKFLENRLNCVLGANGAVYAVRRSLFRPGEGWIVEDFRLPMEIRYAGYRVVYDPEARGTEESAPDFRAEFARKVRIGAGAYQTLFQDRRFLNPLKGLPPFAYFSHKVLRWLAPLFLIAAFVANAFLLGNKFYSLTFALQCAFYLSAFLGFLRERSGRPAGVFSLPLYFSAMNYALLLGMFRFLTGRQRAIWGTTPRRKSVPAVTAQR